MFAIEDLYHEWPASARRRLTLSTVEAIAHDLEMTPSHVALAIIGAGQKDVQLKAERDGEPLDHI
jgi:hypothetical protein